MKRLGKVAMVTVALGLLLNAAAEKSAATQPIQLHELEKDIVRAPVPISGKVTGLQPPKLGEHSHHH